MLYTVLIESYIDLQSALHSLMSYFKLTNFSIKSLFKTRVKHFKEQSESFDSLKANNDAIIALENSMLTLLVTER